MPLPRLKSLHTVNTIELTVVSPLHIGAAGEKLWTENIDFFYDGEEQEVVVIDQHKLLAALQTAYDDRGQPGLEAYQRLLASGRPWSIQDFLKECDIDTVDIMKMSQELRHAPAGEIRPLIRTGMDTPIIPGSSIKGALRSVIFHHLIRDIETHTDNLEKELLGTIDNNIMKFIRLFDAVCTNTGIINCDLFNLYQEDGNWESDFKPNFMLSVEVFLPGSLTDFRLSVADGLLDILENIGKQHGRYYTPRHSRRVINSSSPIQHLFHMVNTYTRTHLERELAFFNRYPQAEDLDFLIDNLNQYIRMTQEPDSCLLRLAFGSGFHGISGDWRFDDHTDTIYHPDPKNRTWNYKTRSMENPRYKSRKVVGRDRETSMMGFVQLKIK